MSFSKAKRFSYKTPEDKIPSPADYLIATKLEKGCSISKAPRFLPPKKEKGTTAACTRLSHSHSRDLRCSTPKTEQGHEGKIDMDLIKSTIIEFNRNDIKRKSIREKSLKEKEKAKSPYRKRTTREPEDYIDTDKLPMFGSEEFIDDDYHSYTSSEELDQLKKIEEYEFNEVCKALQRIQSNKTRKVSNFQETVLHKLENIEKNMENFKENLENLHEKSHIEKVDSDRGKEIVKLSDTRIDSVEKHQKMTDIITEAIEFLSKQFDKERKNVLKDSEDRIYGLVAEIYKTSEKSGEQIEEICKKTASRLADNVNVFLQNTGNSKALEFTSINESNCTITEKYLKGVAEIDNKKPVEVLPQYLQSSKKMDEELEEFVFKSGWFQNEMDIQGNLIEALQKEISEMKRTLCKESDF